MSFVNFSANIDIVTKDQATEEIQNSLMNARELGQEKLNSFIDERMTVPEKDDKPVTPIHAPLHKSKAKTFSSLYDVVQDNKDQDKRTILKADRNVLQHLVICL